MSSVDLETSDVRALVIFASYLSTCLLLTGLIVRDLLKQHNLRRNRRSSSSQATSTSLTSIFAFGACAAISLGITWYYMLSFFSLSYRTWALQHSIVLPTSPRSIEGLKDWLKLIRLGAWLKDVQLFRDAWEVAMEFHSRLLWSQPIFFITTIWAVFIGVRVALQRIRYGWAYMLLGQIVAISFAQSLFYLAVTIYEPENSEDYSEKKDENKDERSDPSAAVWTYTFWHLIMIIFVAIPVILIPATVGTPRFLWALAFPHLILMVPPILDPVLIWRLSTAKERASAQQEAARRCRFAALLGFIAEGRMLLNTFSFSRAEQHLHRHSVAYIHPILESTSIGASNHWHGLFASLYDHPAVTSVGWDSMLCILNYQIWRAFQAR